MRTPTGVSAATFADGLAEMKSAVGDQWVFTEDPDVDIYRDFYSVLWDEAEERVASAAVAPKTVEEVQAVVRAANARGIPLYPISTGRNLGYGGSAPVYSGSVVLDLKRMDRIIEVNENNCSCLVEPAHKWLVSDTEDIGIFAICKYKLVNDNRTLAQYGMPMKYATCNQLMWPDSIQADAYIASKIKNFKKSLIF